VKSFTFASMNQDNSPQGFYDSFIDTTDPFTSESRKENYREGRVSYDTAAIVPQWAQFLNSTNQGCYIVVDGLPFRDIFSDGPTPKFVSTIIRECTIHNLTTKQLYMSLERLGIPAFVTTDKITVKYTNAFMSIDHRNWPVMKSHISLIYKKKREDLQGMFVTYLSPFNSEVMVEPGVVTIDDTTSSGYITMNLRQVSNLTKMRTTSPKAVIRDDKSMTSESARLSFASSVSRGVGSLTRKKSSNEKDKLRKSRMNLLDDKT
jgi:hypothetical protein